MKRVQRLPRFRTMMCALWSLGTCAIGAMALMPPALAQAAAAAAAQPDPRLLPPRQGPADRTLREAIERFPALLDDSTVASRVLAVVVRADGGIMDARLMPAPGQREMAMAHNELQQWLPIADGDGLARTVFRRGESVDGSRPLVTDLTVLSTRLPADFNPERSTRRAVNLMREQRQNLFLPAAGGNINRIAVLLAPDGTVLKEHVHLLNRSDVRPSPRDANHQQTHAARVAEGLEISVDEIGVTGAGTATLGDRSLFVVYAWKRGPMESGPRLYGTPPGPLSADPGRALLLVQRHLPDAFAAEASKTGMPTLLLSSQGEVVRSGRVALSNGGLTSTALQSPVLAGAHIGQVLTQTLVDSSGSRADVLLVWESDSTAAGRAQP